MIGLSHEFAERIASEIQHMSQYVCEVLRTSSHSVVCVTSNGEVTVHTPMYSIVFHEDSFYVIGPSDPPRGSPQWGAGGRIFETSELANPKFTPKRIAEIILEDFERRYSKEVERGYV